MKAKRSYTQSGAANWLMQNTHALKDLPEPGKEWKSKNQPEHIQDRIIKLSAKDIIHRVRRCSATDETIFETNREAYNALQKYIERKENDESEGFLPCGHNGFENLGDDLYQCKRDTCEQIHTKAAINEHND